MIRLAALALSSLAGASLAPGTAHALQLELPSEPRRAARQRSGIDLPRRQGGDLAPKPDERGRLDLPRRGANPAPAADAPPPEPDAPAAPGQAGDPAGVEGNAARVFDELAGARGDMSLAAPAVRSLLALGEPGLVEARTRLSGREGVPLCVAARVLLRSGSPADRSAVARRLQQELPSSVAPTLLSELVQVDPVLASPAYLVALTDHPNAGMRGAAARALEQRFEPSLLPLLASRLSAERADTRLLLVELVGRSHEPEADHILLSRLGDPATKVASRVVSLLAARPSPELEARLLEISVGTRELDRTAAYALLALVELEDRQRAPLLRDEHVPVLLAGLRASEQVVAAASAVALSGIGFRSPASRSMEWLDREVPHALVRFGTGAVFYRDFSGVQDIALRRLAMLTGQSYARDGLAWQRWWSTAAPHFRARRAVIELGPGEGLELVASLGMPTGELVLAGPAAKVDESRLGRTVYYLTPGACMQLVGRIESLGVLGSERLPGRLDSGTAVARSLDVSFGDQGKHFELSPGPAPAWFEEIAEALGERAAESRWQDFRDAARYPTRRAYFEAEAAAWEATPAGSARERRLATAILAALAPARGERRDAGVRELARTYANPGVPAASDFRPLLELLRDEDTYGWRARALADAALASARAAGGAGVPVDASLASELLTSLVGRFGVDANEDTARVLAAAGPQAVRDAAASRDAALRAVAVAALVEQGAPEDLELATGMLADPEPAVEIAALHALAQGRIESARNEILLRARVAPPEVRAQALVAAGELGGEGVLDVLTVALGEGDPALQPAAVEGMAVLADPRSTSLLVSIFVRGPSGPAFESARRGLLEIGPSAWPELLRVAASPARVARREAALLLSEQGVAEAASTMMTILTDNPADARVAAELAVLTGVDLRTSPIPRSRGGVGGTSSSTTTRSPGCAARPSGTASPRRPRRT